MRTGVAFAAAASAASLAHSASDSRVSCGLTSVSEIGVLEFRSSTGPMRASVRYLRMMSNLVSTAQSATSWSEAKRVPVVEELEPTVLDPLINCLSIEVADGFTASSRVENALLISCGGRRPIIYINIDVPHSPRDTCQLLDGTIGNERAPPMPSSRVLSVVLAKVCLAKCLSTRVSDLTDANESQAERTYPCLNPRRIHL